MLQFTVLSDHDWASFLDFLCLRVKLAFNLLSEERWKEMESQLEAELVCWNLFLVIPANGE
jgi:hypothetical protein